MPSRSITLVLPSYARELKKQGYATAFMGKWHLAGEGSIRTKNGIVDHRYHPEHYGFDTISSYLSAEVLRDAMTIRGRKFERPQVLFRDGAPSHLYVASGVNLTGGGGTHSCVLRIGDLKRPKAPKEN